MIRISAGLSILALAIKTNILTVPTVFQSWMSSPDAAILNAIGTDILESTVCVAVETVFISNTKFFCDYLLH